MPSPSPSSPPPPSHCHHQRDRTILPTEKLEVIIFKLEVFDHKARERAGLIAPTLGTHVHVLLTFDAAVEVHIFQSSEWSTNGQAA
ncbi:hypothetical protein Tco_0455855 [Tanacetum coccineum]